MKISCGSTEKIKERKEKQGAENRMLEKWKEELKQPTLRTTGGNSAKSARLILPIRKQENGNRESPDNKKAAREPSDMVAAEIS